MVWECPGNSLGMPQEWSGNAAPSSRDQIPHPSVLLLPPLAAHSMVFYHSRFFFGKGNKILWPFTIPKLSLGKGNRIPWPSTIPTFPREGAHPIPIPRLLQAPIPPNPSRSRIPGVFSRQEFGCCPPAARARPWWGGGGGGGRIPAAAAAAPAFFSRGEGPAFPGNPAEQDPAPGKRNPGGGNPSPAPRDPRGTKNVTALFPTFPGSFLFGRLRILSFLAFRHEFKSGSRWIFRACLGNSKVGGREGEKGGILWEDPSAPRRRGKALILTGEL